MTAASISTTVTRSTRSQASASASENPTPSPPSSSRAGERNPHEQALGGAVARVHQEHAVADDLEVRAVGAEDQLPQPTLHPLQDPRRIRAPHGRTQPPARRPIKPSWNEVAPGLAIGAGLTPGAPAAQRRGRGARP